MKPFKVIKFPLNTIGLSKVSVPEQSRLVSIERQGAHIVAYYQTDAEPIDPGRHIEETFFSIETGKTIRTLPGTIAFYEKTIMFHDGSYVVHVYKVQSAGE